MNTKDIRELAALMKEMGLTSLSYRSGTDSIELTRPGGNVPVTEIPLSTYNESHGSEEPTSVSGFTVKSPMVGVFYRAPGADEQPYVSVGDVVDAGDVLCVIETMKIMNEITAERDGIITEICVANKEVVEFGQPLFRIGLQDG